MHMPGAQTAASINKEAALRELDDVLTSGVRAASEADAIDGVVPARIVEPSTTEDVARVLKWATDRGLTVAPRGGSTKITWGNPPTAADLILSTRRMNTVVEHAWEDMTVVVQAGCTICALQSKLAEHGQHLALDPLFSGNATVGGVIATNDSGSFRLRYGGVRDLIIGATIVLSDGTIAKSGGKVVKNVAGYDLQKLMTGALGTLGVVTEAIFRVHPKAQVTRTLTFHAPDVASANELLVRVHDSQLVPTGIQIRAHSGEASCELDIRFEGIAPGVEAQIATVRTFTDLPPADADVHVWTARERLWNDAPAVICKASVLPDQIARLCGDLGDAGEGWNIVAQSIGLVTIAFRGATLEGIVGLQRHLHDLGGSLVVLECPADWKGQFDVWGSAGDALPLMIRVKQQLDPAGTLNRGRFIGGI